MKIGIVAGVFLAWACMICPAEVLLRNPGFESRDFSGWIAKGKGWSIDRKVYSEGEASALCTVKKGDAPGLRVCLQAVPGVEADRIVEVSLDVSGADVVQTPHSKACLAILCMDAKGAVLKEYRSSVIKPSKRFQLLKIDDAVVLQGTSQIYVMLVVDVFQTATDNDWWRFDNVRISIH